jgi:hypothetical protein
MPANRTRAEALCAQYHTQSLKPRARQLLFNGDLPDRCAPGQPKHREYDAQFNSRQTSPSNRVTLCGPIRKSQATSSTCSDIFFGNHITLGKNIVHRSVPCGIHVAIRADRLHGIARRRNARFLGRFAPGFAIRGNARGRYLNQRQAVEYDEGIRTRYLFSSAIPSEP